MHVKQGTSNRIDRRVLICTNQVMDIKNTSEGKNTIKHNSRHDNNN